MKKIILFSLIFFINLSFSQNTAEVLLEQLNKHPKKDTLRCFLLNQLIEEEQDKSVWIKYNNELKKIVLENLKTKLTKNLSTIYQKYLSISFNNQGAYYVYDDQYQKAIQEYKKSYVWASKINYLDGSALSLQNIGTAYDYVGKLDSSLYYLKKAHTIALKSKNNSSIAYILTDLGYVHNNLGNNNLAINYNLKALTVFEQLKDNEGIERTSFAIGRIFDTQNDYSKSLYYYKKSLTINKKIKDLQRQALILNSISSIYIKQNKFEEAIKTLNSTIELSKKNKYESALASSYKFYGDLYLKQKKTAQAAHYYNQSATIYKEIGSYNFYSKLMIQLATINWQKKSLHLAKEQALTAYEIGKNSFYPTEEKNASDVLSKIYEFEKDYQNAYKYKTIASTIADSIYFDETKDIALKATNKYESEKQKAQILSLQKDKQIAKLNNEKQHNLILIIIFVFISIVLSNYIFFNRFKTKQQNEYLKSKLEEAEKTILAEKKASQSELKAFKSQMNPHFFYNALNTVQSYILTNDKKLAISYLSKFSILTRSILEMTEKESISIADEIKTLTLYLDIEKARFNEDFEYSIQIENIDDTELTKIPSMFLQPYVENAIKHGLLHKEGRKELNINFTIENQVIVIQIEDNGIGREKSMQLNAIKNKNHTSFATEAIQNRIDILNKMRAKPIQLTFTDKKNSYQHALGTIVNIKIPL